MKKQFLLIILLLFSTLTFGQSSLDSLRMVLPVGHTGYINSAIFSTDNRLLVTASSDATVRIWDVNSAKEIFVFREHFQEVKSAEFSLDNKLIITASADSTARIFEVSSGKELIVFKENSGCVWSAKFSLNGKLAVTTSGDGTARIFEVSTGKELHVFKGVGSYSTFRSAIFCSQDKLLLTHSEDGTVLLWDIESRKELKRFGGGSKDFIKSATLSNDGAALLIVSGDSVRICNIETGLVQQVFRGHAGSVNSAVFSSDGNYVLTASSDNTIKLWSVKTSKEIKSFEVHSKEVISARYSYDGKYILSESRDGTGCVWNSKTGKLLHVLRGHVLGEGFIPIFTYDNKNILTVSLGNIRFWDIKTGKVLKNFKGHSIGVSAVSSDINSILTYGGDDELFFCELFLWNGKTGSELKRLKGHTKFILSALLSSDLKSIFTTSWDNTQRLWDLESGEELFIIDIGWQFTGIQFRNTNVYSVHSYRNVHILLEIWDSLVLLRNIQSLNEPLTLEGHSGRVISVIYSSDNDKVLTASEDGTARVWDATTGEELLILEGHTRWVTSAKYNKDNSKVLTTSTDSTARIWDAVTGKEQLRLRGHAGGITSANFNNDNSKILTTSSDNTICLWDVITGKEILHYGDNYLNNSYSDATTACFNDDGKYILTKSIVPQISVLWDSETGKQLKSFNSDAVFSLDGKYLILTGNDYKCIIWDIASGDSIYERIQLKNNNYLVKLPNSPYYMCSKDASKMLHYVTPSLKVIGFEQLDPIYNRPDIVLDSIGKYFGNSDGGMIEEYRKSWEKRIDRLGLDKDKLGKGEIAVPDAEIVEADKIAYENKEGKLVINVKANDPKYTLRRFNIYVNEVPLYGSAGISIAQLKKQVWDTTVSVPLSLGENKIQVSVMNELGLENFKYPTYVNYTPENNKEIFAKTHYIGIGVNEFKEAGHNLKYCVDDVTDLAEAYKSNSTVTKLFTNQNVTRENILKLKQYLKDSTTVNDKVIISCSSHGLLDDSLNFYLATNDVDFKNPKARGLKYEELEGLLDGIPARQKLLLLDACNSGENDKTELMKQDLAKNQHQMDAKKIEGAKGVIIKLEEENKSNFKKMNELFVNVRNNTGSVIISAAGGQESALEAIQVDGKTIENGAFTYSVLEYLKANEGKADALTVNKLKQYVENRVEEITNGKQKPTSRQETMEVDWEVR